MIFGAGVVMGAVLVQHLLRHPAKIEHHAPLAVAPTNRPPAERPIDLNKVHQPEILSQQFIQQLDDVLQLSPVQRDAIQKIICNGQELNHCIWTNCSAQSRQVIQDVRQHIREQLTPDQKKEFEKLLKQNHPAAHKPTGGTNGVPGMPPTNPPPLLTTNLAGI